MEGAGQACEMVVPTLVSGHCKLFSSTLGVHAALSVNKKDVLIKKKIMAICFMKKVRLIL